VSVFDDECHGDDWPQKSGSPSSAASEWIMTADYDIMYPCHRMVEWFSRVLLLVPGGVFDPDQFQP
jgi:hypothetical protein